MNSLLYLKLVEVNNRQEISSNGEWNKITIFREISPKKSSDREHNASEGKNSRTHINKKAAEEGRINICSKFI